MLKLENLTRTVQTPAGDRDLVRDISFTLPARAILSLLGPSGSGKSTLLRLINRLDEPTTGRIYLAGQDVRSMDPPALRRRIGFVAQAPALFPGDVTANIGYGPGLRHQMLPRNELLRLLDLVGLPAALAEQDARTLSVGQAQRVTIARALANGPELLLLDEPTSALDLQAAGAIVRLMRDLRDSLGLTVVLVTHLLRQAEEVADRVVLLVDGQVAEAGPAESFFAEPATETGRLFRRGELEGRS